MNKFYLLILLISFLIFSCNNGNANSGNEGQNSSVTVTIKEDSVSYILDDIEYKGFIYYNPNNSDKLPGVLVVHEWWGLNDYSRSRARQLAELGYVSMAVDMYGDGKTGEDPKTAQALATPYYKDPALSKTRLDAALGKLKEFSQVDTANIAAVGYCYGGFIVLNAAKLGVNLKGVVSFHGDLSGVPVKKELVKAQILVCHGEADDFVNPQVAAFKKSMDSAGVNYIFKSYPNATHAFTNPAATEKGKKFNMPIQYNEAADTASWNDMKAFLDKIFTK